jgi:hypothetical protein
VYPNLKKYKSIDQLLGPHKACVLLYETKQDYGHYVCVMKQGNNKYEFFDPYGDKPDGELKFIPENFREVSGQEYPHLCYLLYKSGGSVEYNDHKLQKKSQDVSTCGRHVACRINFRDTPLEEYVKRLKGVRGMTPDEVVTVLTS